MDRDNNLQSCSIVEGKAFHYRISFIFFFYDLWNIFSTLYSNLIALRVAKFPIVKDTFLILGHNLISLYATIMLMNCSYDIYLIFILMDSFD